LPRKLRYDRDNGSFFGREDELEWIRTSFEKRRILAIHGLGGIGKTRIVVEYIYAYEHDYHAVFRANADTNETRPSSFVSVAQQLLDCESKKFAGYNTSPNLNFTSIAHRHNLTDHDGSILLWSNVTDRVLDKVLSWLSDASPGNWLLVLDNVDDLDNIDLRTFFPTAALGRILVMSRNPTSRHFGEGLETLSLSEHAAVQLLL
jgi:hypothetical protein